MKTFDEALQCVGVLTTAKPGTAEAAAENAHLKDVGSRYQCFTADMARSVSFQLMIQLWISVSADGCCVEHGYESAFMAGMIVGSEMNRAELPVSDDFDLATLEKASLEGENESA